MPSATPSASVRGRLILLVSLVALPALFLACAMVYVAYRHSRDAVSEKLFNTARAAARVVDGEVESSLRTLAGFAASRELREADFDGVDALARATLIRESRWLTITGLDGQQVVNTRVPRGTVLPRAEDPPEVVQALSTGTHYVSDLRSSAVAGVLTVRVYLPWIRDGRLAGSLALVLLPEELSQSINVEDFQPGGVISIVDRAGRIIERNKGRERFVGEFATPDMKAAVTARRQGVQDSITLEGIPVLTAIGRAECGWSILIGAPQSELYRPARALVAWGLAGTGFIVTLAVFMALWIGQSVVRGVQVLSAEAEALGRGQTLPGNPSGLQEFDAVGQSLRRMSATLLRRTRTLEILNRVNAGLAAEHDLQKIVQSVTDAGREVSGAAFGAFFYNVENDSGESYMLYTLSGAPREAFEKFGHPRNTAVFAPTFAGAGPVRVADIQKDPRYGRMPPHHGMPKGHLPVRSYLAVSVKAKTGEVIGGLFFGHPKPDVFTAEAEELVAGLAAEAAIAIENAKLYRALETELAVKSRTEAELRAAQERLKQHAGELERMVEERTDSLRESVAQMEEFSYTVSHDLRSPLRSMHSYAELLLAEHGSQLDPAAQGYLQRIVRAADRMYRMTSDLLSYSRVSRTEVKLEPTDVSAIVLAVIEHFPELKPPTVVKLMHPLEKVMANETSLAQCIGNLMTNAAKFVRPGEAARITVRTERRGGKVRLWIEDAGIGIPPRAREGLFQIFHRAHTKLNYAGTGMGLAIVRRAVEKIGGTCGVESDGSTGSRFWIELQAADAAPGTNGVQEPGPSITDASRAGGPDLPESVSAQRG